MTRPTVHVPHLGGIDVAYQKSKTPHDAKKPTLVLVHSFMTTSDLYSPQLEHEEITKAANLVAIDLLGHGQTRITDTSGGGGGENFTYWDSAIMIIQAMQALGVEKYFVLGTSQGGFVAVRMALLAPKKVNKCYIYTLYGVQESILIRITNTDPWPPPSRNINGLRI